VAVVSIVGPTGSRFQRCASSVERTLYAYQTAIKHMQPDDDAN